jgi:hypothetical protein
VDPEQRRAQLQGLPVRRRAGSAPPFLLYEADRELLVPDANQRRELWTTRVWPGALLVEGEVVGTWRRANAVVAIQTWRRLSTAEREAVEAEAESFPLPGLDGQIVVRWDD